MQQPHFKPPPAEAYQAGRGPSRLTGTLASLTKDAEAYLSSQREAQQAQLETQNDVRKLNLAFKRLSEYLVDELGALQRAQRLQSDEAAQHRQLMERQVKALRQEVEAMQAGSAAVGHAGGGADRDALRKVEQLLQQEMQELRDVCSAVRRYATQQAGAVRTVALAAQGKAEEAARAAEARAHAESVRAQQFEMQLLEARQDVGELREAIAALTLEQTELRRALQEAMQRVQGRGEASLQAWEPSWAAREAWESEARPHTPDTLGREDSVDLYT